MEKEKRINTLSGEFILRGTEVLMDGVHESGFCHFGTVVTDIPDSIVQSLPGKVVKGLCIFISQEGIKEYRFPDLDVSVTVIERGYLSRDGCTVVENFGMSKCQGVDIQINDLRVDALARVSLRRNLYKEV